MMCNESWDSTNSAGFISQRKIYEKFSVSTSSHARVDATHRQQQFQGLGKFQTFPRGFPWKFRCHLQPWVSWVLKYFTKEKKTWKVHKRIKTQNSSDDVVSMETLKRCVTTLIHEPRQLRSTTRFRSPILPHLKDVFSYRNETISTS